MPDEDVLRRLYGELEEEGYEVVQRYRNLLNIRDRRDGTHTWILVHADGSYTIKERDGTAV